MKMQGLKSRQYTSKPHDTKVSGLNNLAAIQDNGTEIKTSE